MIVQRIGTEREPAVVRRYKTMDRCLLKQWYRQILIHIINFVCCKCLINNEIFFQTDVYLLV